MRQRANIVRTLAYEPEVILMDEPFGPLDAQTRLILQNQLLELWQEERKTIIFITHDLGEAVALADRVVVMSARPGRIKTDRAGADSASAQPVRNPQATSDFCATYQALWLSLEDEVKKGAAQWQAQKLNAAGAAALPPGAANVEDDIRAWEAQERREKWKLMIVRVMLAIVLLSIWEYGTDRWFDALWFSSPLRVLRHSGIGRRTTCSSISS